MSDNPNAGFPEQLSPFETSFRIGTDSISSNEVVTFTKYFRVTFPIDGFVFWVNSTMIQPINQLNSETFNNSAFNAIKSDEAIRNAASPPPSTVDNVILVQGSFVYSTDKRQEEDETISVNKVTFTAQQAVQAFNSITPDCIYIGNFKGLRFAFTSQSTFFFQQDLFHYVGDAIYPIMETQIIDDASALNDRFAIVSNSLPIWLAINQGAPMFPLPSNSTITLYPSFLVPANASPPYGVVHIDYNSTKALQAVPYWDGCYSHYQLVEEEVTITFYGVRSNSAIDFVDYVCQLSLMTDNFGIMNSPVVLDDKRVQSELGIIAQKKRVQFHINYYQTRMNDIARQLIKISVPTFNVADEQAIVSSLVTPGVWGVAIAGFDVFGSNQIPFNA